MNGMGHNNGPTMESGRAWRKHVWTKARADLLPRLPIEILRTRVARARELGLDYKTYASVRASTGRDVVGFLFSTNALRVLKTLSVPPSHAAKLAAMQNCSRIAVVQPPLSAEAIARANARLIDGATAAPLFTANWPETRGAIRQAVQLTKSPADAVLLIGDTAVEREWSHAGRLAGYLEAEQFFGKVAVNEL